MIEFAGRIAERVTLAVGADPDRVAWAIDLARKAAADAGRDPAEISFGAYVNVGCHPDLDAARDLISGAVAAFAHFSSMPGSTGAGLAEADREVVAEVGRRYDSNEHLSNTAAHTDALNPEFVDRFAVVGPPDVCAERLRGLAGARPRPLRHHRRELPRRPRARAHRGAAAHRRAAPALREGTAA